MRIFKALVFSSFSVLLSYIFIFQLGWAASSSSHSDPVAVSLAADIADAHATRIWEGSIARGKPFSLHKEDGTPFAYVFPYARNASEFPSYEKIFDTVRSAAQTHDIHDKRFYNAVTGSMGSFGCVEVSATRENFPILGVWHSLHPYFLYSETAADTARTRLKSDRVVLENMEYTGPHDLYFNFSSDKGKIKLHAYLLKTKEELYESYKGNTFPQNRIEAENDIIRKRREKAWEEVDNPKTRSLNDAYKWIDNYTLVPVVDWTHWCVPTAMTMTAGYWDHYDPRQGTWPGYGRIIDFWFDHGPLCQNSNVTNVPNFIDEIIDHSTCSWSSQGLVGALNTINGYNFSWTDIKGTAGNDWCWGDIVSEVNSNRPSVWGVGPAQAHAMTVIGYRYAGSQKSVIVYNTWGSTAEQQLAEYNYDQWGGAPNTKTGIGRLVPDGGTGLNHAILVSPRGGETLKGNSTITWFVWGDQIKWSIIQFSKDGGNTWSAVHDSLIPTNPGWNNFTAALNNTTSQGRIRIYCFSSILMYLAGDGSYRNFFVQGKADLVPVAACTRNSQGELIVRVKNQGTVAAGASVAQVEFFPGGAFDVQIPSIDAGSTAEGVVLVPSECWNPDCDFQIKVDVSNQVNEADEGNNSASSACIS
ncbi:MAG: CARDB domain-containing protein [Thermodesulfobacteriota bacterium]